MDIEERVEHDELSLWVGDSGLEQNAHARKNIAQFKESLVDVMDHLPESLQLDTAQRDNLVRPLVGFTNHLYLMNPVSVVAGYVATMLARRDRNNLGGGLLQRHVEETMEVFRQRLANRELTPYDIVRYALAYNRGQAPRARAIPERRV